jgi:hypothetical protein
MIVPAMNQVEMYRELRSGYNSVERKLSGLATKPRRKAIKEKSKSISFNYVDPNQNKWFIHILFDKKIYITIPFLYYQDENNRMAALRINWETGECEAYTAHFFSRFDERLDLKCSNTLEKMRTYFLMAFDVKMEEGKDCRFHSELPCGVGFGHRVSKFWLQYKTFVSHDMLQGQQKDTSHKLRGDAPTKLFDDQLCAIARAS